MYPILPMYPNTRYSSMYLTMISIFKYCYTGEIRKDRCKGGGGVLIATKQEYDIQRIELEANISAETVWATISLKDQLA